MLASVPVLFVGGDKERAFPCHPIVFKNARFGSILCCIFVHTIASYFMIGITLDRHPDLLQTLS